MIKNWSLKTKLLSGMLLVILLFTLGAVNNYWKLTGAQSTLSQETERNAELKAAYELKNYVGILYSNQADVIINQSDEAAKAYKENEVKFREYLEFIALRSDNPKEVELAASLRTASEGFIKSFDVVMDINKKGSKLTAAQLRDENKKADDQTDEFKQTIYTVADQYINRFNQESKESTEYLTDEIKSVNMTLIISCIIDVLLGIGIALLLSRIIIGPINVLMNVAQSIAGGDLTRTITSQSKDEVGKLTDSFSRMILNLQELIKEVNANSHDVAVSSKQLSASAEETSAASNEIATSIQAVARGAEAQGLTSNESARAMEEMSIGIQRIAETSSSVSDVSMDASEKARNGNLSLQQVIRQMESIRATVDRTASMVQKLDKQSIEIGSIVSVISNIATQTNLLALNAAIEAARAGEHGRGFAVVAGEVRKLAEQSGSSANQIIALIEQIQQGTQLAVEAMNEGTREVHTGIVVVHEAGEAFQLILRAIDQVADQIRDVSAVAEEMSARSEQVTASVIESSNIAQQSAFAAQNVAGSAEQQLAALQEVAAFANDLNSMSLRLQQAVGKFKL
ncbi:methyl-accepting chemotaxis protein [Paenibacillus qinlingensis]|uniref:methyl-accepting chemotaxis protein n=1 Tax=Paenibacillus qinlingensis TaxID=1837343 RepID=UPI001565D21B|nr:HAMP domain-containing methyl-accepting chemotaxis protein [Paenibacillus qinlingensis]NQX63865.1 methyl-accepting chemotaxis protein [Paenibacillus qinlingensis]